MKTSSLIICVLVLLLSTACMHHGMHKHKCGMHKDKCSTCSCVRDGVFIHVSAGPDNPHRVLMALKMAELMAETQDVAMYFDIKGVEVLLKGSDDLTYRHFPSSHTQVKKLIEMKVPVMACPGCLKAADKSADDLMDGVKVAEKDLFFKFTRGRILTLDY